MKPSAVTGVRIRTIGISRPSGQTWRCFALRGMTFENRKWESRRSGPREHYSRGVRSCTYRDIEAEIVTHSVNQPDQT
jgi:hypothetical protein